MRSISFSALARTLAAALLVVGLATGAYAARGVNGVGTHAPAPAPAAPSSHSDILLGGEDPSACGGGLALPAPSSFGDAAEAVKGLSRATQAYLKQCHCVTQECVADALDRYAEALAALAPRLPKDLQTMPDVVAQAASRVRAARTRAESIAALNHAAALIHKDLMLVSAEDPGAQRQTRSAAFVVDTLNVASLSLERGGAL
jgi:hypothetical protein